MLLYYIFILFRLYCGPHFHFVSIVCSEIDRYTYQIFLFLFYSNISQLFSLQYNQPHINTSRQIFSSYETKNHTFRLCVHSILESFRSHHLVYLHHYFFLLSIINTISKHFITWYCPISKHLTFFLSKKGEKTGTY